MDSYSRKVHFHYYEVDVTRISNTYKFLFIKKKQKMFRIFGMEIILYSIF